MTHLSPDLIANLLAAHVPVLPGALWLWPSVSGGGSIRIEDQGHADDNAGTLLADQCYPDPRDRATFLLLCDLAEHRGVGWFTTELDHLNIGLARGHRRAWEQEDKRAATIAGLCHALAETEVGRG